MFKTAFELYCLRCAFFKPVVFRSPKEIDLEQFTGSGKTEGRKKSALSARFQSRTCTYTIDINGGVY